MTRGNTKFITFLYVQERTHYEKGSIKKKVSPESGGRQKRVVFLQSTTRAHTSLRAIITHYFFFFFFFVKKLRMIYLFLEYVLSVGAIHVIKEKNNIC